MEEKLIVGLWSFRNTAEQQKQDEGLTSLDCWDDKSEFSQIQLEHIPLNRYQVV